MSVNIANIGLFLQDISFLLLLFLQCRIFIECAWRFRSKNRHQEMPLGGKQNSSSLVVGVDSMRLFRYKQGFLCRWKAPTVGGTWWHIGRVEAFRPNPALAAMSGPWASP